jgi:hypothetical protein
MNSPDITSYTSQAEYYRPLPLEAKASNKPLTELFENQHRSQSTATIRAPSKLPATSPASTPSTSKLNIAAKEWIPNAGLNSTSQSTPIQREPVEVLQGKGTTSAFAPTKTTTKTVDVKQTSEEKQIEEYLKIAEVGDQFIEKTSNKMHTQELISFLEFLSNYPIEALPHFYLEKAAGWVKKMRKGIDLGDLCNIIKLFNKLKYNPKVLIDSLASEISERLPSANPRRLITILSTFQSIYTRDENPELFARINKYIESSINKFRSDELLSISYYLAMGSEDDTLLIDRGAKAMINLAANDLRAKGLNPKFEEDPLFLELTPIISIEALKFYKSLIPYTFKLEYRNITRGEVSTLDWDDLNSEVKKTRLFNAMANIVISQKDEYTPEQINTIKEIYKGLGIDFDLLYEAQI